MNNPVFEAVKKNKPFVYLHTHVIDRTILESALKAGKILEVDMSVDIDGQVYVGHPENFYTELKNIPLPDNLPLDEVLEKMKKANLYLVIDCKDERAIPKAKNIIQQFGVENVLFYSQVDAFKFEPYPEEISIEPQWIYEDLPYDEVTELRTATGVPLIMSARGLTKKRLLEEKDSIIERVVQIASGQAVAVNFNLPGGEIPPSDIVNRLMKQGILICFNVDIISPINRPPIYIGMTDDARLATDYINF
ncbi:MAG TPA: hypothetical protein VMQ58_02320 [Candidatus Saccharimonadales bacterium]|nr:hypothetical protein [Candidatus Saccharimonadales bacterium]